jgi:hypothetical protein
MRRCPVCGSLIASTSRRDRRYCSTAGRMTAYRRRRADSTWRAAAFLLERQYPERWSTVGRKRGFYQGEELAAYLGSRNPPQ